MNAELAERAETLATPRGLQRLADRVARLRLPAYRRHNPSGLCDSACSRLRSWCHPTSFGEVRQSAFGAKAAALNAVLGTVLIPGRHALVPLGDDHSLANEDQPVT